MSLEIREIVLPPINVRSGSPKGIAEDIGGIARLLGQSSVVPLGHASDIFARTADMLREDELDGDHHLIAYDKAQGRREPLGLLSYTTIGDRMLHIDNLVVDAPYRRSMRRIGSHLIESTMMRAEKLHIPEVLVNADRDAVAFYEKHDFVLDDRYQDEDSAYPLMSRRVHLRHH